MLQKTLSMQAGAGYAVPFEPISTVTVLSRAECYVATVFYSHSPVAPTQSPAPSAGQAVDWIHMLANEKINIGGDDESQQNAPTALLIWAVGSGDLLILGK